MLKSIRLENFKLHEKTTIDAARITVFIGPNNSGKSSVFQAVLALRQAATRTPPNNFFFLDRALRKPPGEGQPFLFEPQLIDIGNFEDVVRQDQNEVRIGVTGTVNSPRPLGDIGPIQVSVQTAIQDNRLVGHEGSLSSSKEQLRWKHTTARPGVFPQPYTRVPDYNCTLRFATVDNFDLVQPGGHEIPPGTPPDAVNKLTQIAQSLASSPRQLIISLHAIYALRGFEEWASPVPEFPSDNLERFVLRDRAVALASTLAANSKLRREVSERLQDLLSIRIEIELAGADYVKLFATPTGLNGRETLFANEGAGANQLPFILVPLALARPDETVLLAEPEVHLHPKAQSELTALLLRVAEKQNLQLFIETHSEHVLHKLLHAVAKGELALDDLAIYYFEPPEEGVAKVNRLEIDERGGVKGGLPGFYDQSLTELSDYLDALKKS